ncbi:MAG: hypothetical protein BEN18_04395 [Epulopiscium sp. Nuni2H_MBin001]|nr:MAG: hypothetical protein BEN18_04395 [Epulopiscium sp. Nuni2H_MBin001]
MNLVEFILISFALIIDSMIVCTVNGMTYKHLTKTQTLNIVILFGLTQGLFITAGYFLGMVFADFLSQYAGIVTAAIFTIIGVAKMKGALTSDEHEIEQKETLSYKVITIQAVATSLDAFAVGISFSFMAVNLLLTIGTVTTITILFSLLAIKFGQKSGELLGSKAEFLGGLFLLFVAARALL